MKLMLTYFFILAIGVSAHGQINTDLLQIDPTVAPNFGLLRRGSNNLYYHDASHGSVSIYGYRLAPTSDPHAAWLKMTATSAVVVKPTLPPSLLPLGDYATHDFQLGVIRVKGQLERFHISCRLSYKRQAEGFVPPPGYSTDTEMVEGAVRNSLARLVGQELSPSGNVNISGRAVTGMMTRGGTRMAPLSGWANARGFNLTYNRRLGTCSFTANGRQIIVPLSAKKIKVGANWKDLGEPILRKNDEWYVPFDAFQREI